MGKSYWFKDWPTGNGQKGNFSNNKQDTFNPKEGFIGTRLQQGVPLLDRDWNELDDIRRYQEAMLRKHYLGDGTPNDGFRISALDPSANNFMISAGRFLVDGLEAVNEPAGANFILYSSQAGLPALTKVKATVPPSVVTRNDTVYLDVWIEEVTGADLPRLKNPDDVAMETCIRHRLRWFVRVDEGSLGHIPGEGHHFCDLARITRTSARDTIGSADVKDLRSGWQSLEAVQSRLRNAINSMISGNMPSGPTVDLATFPSADEGDYSNYYHNVVKDDMGNMILFWLQETDIWAKRYSASTRIWGGDMQIASGTAIKSVSKSFKDSRGDIWIFWKQYEESSKIYSLWARRYNSSTGVWTENAQLTSGATDRQFLNAFGDNNGNIWYFWLQIEGSTGTYNVWVKRYTSGSWGGDTQLTTGTISIYNYNIFIDLKGGVWVFWQQTDAGSTSSNFLAKRFSGGTWSGDFALTSNTAVKIYANAFEDSNGIIWFFWQQIDAGTTVYNIWGKRFISGSWVGDARLTSGTQAKYYNSSIIDARGDVWVFWQQLDGPVYNFWAKRFTANAWSNDMQLTAGVTNKYFYTPVAGKKMDVFFLYSIADVSNASNIVELRFNFDSNSWWTNQLTFGTGYKYPTNIYAFSNGDMGVFWAQDDYYMFGIYNISTLSSQSWPDTFRVTNRPYTQIDRVFERSNGDIWLLLRPKYYGNLWCSRLIDSDWAGEERLISGSSQKEIKDVFEDASGDIWIFWTIGSFINRLENFFPRQIKVKKIYGSI